MPKPPTTTPTLTPTLTPTRSARLRWCPARRGLRASRWAVTVPSAASTRSCGISSRRHPTTSNPNPNPNPSPIPITLPLTIPLPLPLPPTKATPYGRFDKMMAAGSKPPNEAKEKLRRSSVPLGLGLGLGLRLGLGLGVKLRRSSAPLGLGLGLRLRLGLGLGLGEAATLLGALRPVRLP